MSAPDNLSAEDARDTWRLSPLLDLTPEQCQWIERIEGEFIKRLHQAGQAGERVGLLSVSHAALRATLKTILAEENQA